MASAVYALCAITSVACAVLLLRQYRRTGDRLLLWSGVCFVGLALNNLLLVADLILVPTVDLRLYRSLTAAGGVLAMLWGLIWEGS